MATETNDTAAEATDGVDRPRFRGCIFCYTAECAVYAVRRLRD